MTASSGGGLLSDTDRLRLRRSIHQWFIPIAGVLMVLALVGAGAAYAPHVDPGETTEERVISTWSDQAEFTHTATVVQDTAAFPAGTELRNRPVYYTQLAPDATVEYETGYIASDSGSLDIEAVLELRWQSSDGDGSGLWQVTEPVASEDWSNVSPGETKQISTKINVTEVQERINAIESEIGSSRGSAEAVLVARTSHVGSVNGESVDQHRIHGLPLDHQGTTYGFAEPDLATSTSQRTVPESIPVEYGPLRSIGSILLMFGSVLGLLILGITRVQGVFMLSPEEEAALRHMLVREEYDEWISSGQVPHSSSDRPTVKLSSLSGVVNVAIDSSRRVIEDGNRYVVTLPELTYQFVNDAPSISAIHAEDDSHSVDVDADLPSAEAHSDDTPSDVILNDLPGDSPSELSNGGNELIDHSADELSDNLGGNGREARSTVSAPPDPPDDSDGKADGRGEEL